ncbi:ABC-type branched-subunit amino acid transport system substrate-binding protein [Marmoricola sp. OAE513]|uniref:ABC transporter substrate-binding protein n=1 Tax=Marmoricola sp. OAE513 TaxID=2817894 RepID=UPI001AE17C63
MLIKGRRTSAALVAVVAAALLVTACGSRVSPEKARAMHQDLADLARGDAPAGDTVVPSGDQPVATGETGTTLDPDAPADGPATPGGIDPSDGDGVAPPTGTGVNAPTGAGRAGPCDGLKNQTGVTDKEIVLANASDLSGPVPGLFAAARDGVRAYIAYFNATSKLCGRSLRLVEYDSRTDATGDTVAYEKACSEAFAVIGSVSILDSGGASTAQRCGIPDLRSVSLSNERVRCNVCYPMQSSRTGYIGIGPYVQMRKENKAASENAAFLYLNTGGSPVLAQGYAQVAKAAGWKVKMIQGIDTADFNYGPYVQRMKGLGIKYVHFVSATPQAIRLARAMRDAGFTPEIYQLSQTQYTREYTEGVGANGDGSLISLPHGMFNQPNAEMKLYLTWLQQVRPGADPSSFGVFAWSAMRMFIENASQLGGKLTRASLLKEVRKERKWTANGMHLNMDVGGKTTYTCAYLTRLSGGTWRHAPKSQVCGRLIKTSFADD